MKKLVCLLLAAVMLAGLCGCARFSPNNDPMLKYEAMAKQASEKKGAKSSGKSIQKFVEKLVREKDYNSAGQIVAAEYSAKRPYEYAAVCKLFTGHEEAVEMDVWTELYRTATENSFNTGESIEKQMDLMRLYHGILRKQLHSQAAILDYAADHVTYPYGGIDVDDKRGEQLAKCGTAPKGKALVFIKDGMDQKLELSLTAALPEELLPGSLEEVEYIVRMKYTKKVVGTYTNGGDAVRMDLDITILHYPDREILKTYHTISGEEPPRSMPSAKGSKTGATGLWPAGKKVSAPLADAFEFLKQLG